VQISGLVFASCDDPKSIVARHINSGEVAWKEEIDRPDLGMTSAEAKCLAVDVSGDGPFVFYGAKGGVASALQSDTGSKAWHMQAETRADAESQALGLEISCLVADSKLGLVLHGSRDGLLSARDFYSGELKWEHKVSDAIVLSIAVEVSSSLMFSGGKCGVVAAWNVHSGEQVWDRDLLDEQSKGGPSEANDVVSLVTEAGVLFAGLRSGEVAAVICATGKKLRRFWWHFGSLQLCVGGGGVLVSVASHFAVLDARTFAKHGVVIQSKEGLLLPPWYSRPSYRWGSTSSHPGT